MVVSVSQLLLLQVSINCFNFYCFCSFFSIVLENATFLSTKSTNLFLTQVSSNWNMSALYRHSLFVIQSTVFLVYTAFNKIESITTDPYLRKWSGWNNLHYCPMSIWWMTQILHSQVPIIFYYFFTFLKEKGVCFMMILPAKAIWGRLVRGTSPTTDQSLFTISFICLMLVSLIFSNFGTLLKRKVYVVLAVLLRFGEEKW